MEAEVGMLVVETIAKIRRAYFVHGQPIKAICRELGVSRKVVRKVIRSEATEFRYERETQPLPKMGPWSAELDRLLAANESKAARERLTLIRLFEELRGLGYAGGYDAVRRYARRWSRERGASTASAYVPLSFAPGEAYQFDWSHEVVLLSGVTVIVKAAHVRLCHSRMLLVRAYPRETQEMVFDRRFGPGETIYDPWHYVPVLARKPGALRNGARFKDWLLPASLERVRRKLKGSDDGDRQMAKVLSAVLGDGLTAVEGARAGGPP